VRVGPSTRIVTCAPKRLGFVTFEFRRGCSGRPQTLDIRIDDLLWHRPRRVMHEAGTSKRSNPNPRRADGFIPGGRAGILGRLRAGPPGGPRPSDRPRPGPGLARPIGPPAGRSRRGRDRATRDRTHSTGRRPRNGRGEGSHTAVGEGSAPFVIGDTLFEIPIPLVPPGWSLPLPGPWSMSPAP
jgi:hypothetical protein